MTSYYATAFKTGKFPEITQDALYAWARPTTTNANSGDPVGKPTNSDTVSILTIEYIFIMKLKCAL